MVSNYPKFYVPSKAMYPLYNWIAAKEIPFFVYKQIYDFINIEDSEKTG